MVTTLPDQCCTPFSSFPQAARGVSNEEWLRFANEVSHVVQDKRPSVFCCLMSWATALCCIVRVFAPFLLPLAQSFVIYCLCSSSPFQHECKEGSYQRAVAEWLGRLNASLLAPRRMYAKVQTVEETVSYNDGTQDRSHTESLSWLAIALTDEEAHALQLEPVVWTPKCCSNRTEKAWCQCKRVI